MSEVIACRICGRTWPQFAETQQRTARGVHQNSHVRRGEAIGKGDDIRITPLGRRLFPDSKAPNTDAASPSALKGPNIRPGSDAGKIRDAFPQMPTEFSTYDIRKKLPNVSKSAISAVLQWARKRGILKEVKRTSKSEWLSQGHLGAAPITYTFVGFDVEKPADAPVQKRKRRSREEMSLANAEKASLAAPISIPVFLPQQEEQHACDATAVLENVQRSLATLNLLVAMQSLPIEQAIALSGTIAAVRKATK